MYRSRADIDRDLRSFKNLCRTYEMLKLIKYLSSDRMKNIIFLKSNL